MKKIICKKVYDTDTATVVNKKTFSYYGDPSGWEETLFVTPEGLYFLYTNGGADSKYTSEDIQRVAKTNVKKYMD